MNQNCFEYCVYKIVLHYMYIILFVVLLKHFLLLFIPYSKAISIYKENKVGYTVNYREIESIDH